MWAWRKYMLNNEMHGSNDNFSWRRGSGSNRRIKVLQTFALPLGYRAPIVGYRSKLPRFEPQVKLRTSASPCFQPRIRQIVLGNHMQCQPSVRSIQ